MSTALFWRLSIPPGYSWAQSEIQTFDQASFDNEREKVDLQA